MFALKWLLIAASVAMFGTAAGVVGYDVYLAFQFQRLVALAGGSRCRYDSPGGGPPMPTRFV
jgi:hypothetical protein